MSVEAADLEQEAYVSLLRLSKRFDRRKSAFGTIGATRARGAMVDCLRREAWPRSIRSLRRKHDVVRDRLRQELCSEPTYEDMAAALGVTVKQFTHDVFRIQQVEATATDAAETKITPDWMRHQSNAVDPFATLLQGESRRMLLTHMAKLPSREAFVLERYYFDEIPMSAIGPEIGVNESRVSQLHARALRRMREWMN